MGAPSSGSPAKMKSGSRTWKRRKRKHLGIQSTFSPPCDRLITPHPSCFSEPTPQPSPEGLRGGFCRRRSVLRPSPTAGYCLESKSHFWDLQRKKQLRKSEGESTGFLPTQFTQYLHPQGHTYIQTGSPHCHPQWPLWTPAWGDKALVSF